MDDFFKKIQKYVGYILTFLTIIGWGISIGVYKSTINKLEEDVKSSNELWEKQLKINGQLEIITRIMLNEMNDEESNTN